jgi:hypothetical protein
MPPPSSGGPPTLDSAVTVGKPPGIADKDKDNKDSSAPPVTKARSLSLPLDGRYVYAAPDHFRPSTTISSLTPVGV